MENRLELNKRPVYELPGEVIVSEYLKRPDTKRCKTPNFIPDLCIDEMGNVKVAEKGNTSNQIWIKSENKKLIYFIKSYDFSKVLSNAVAIKKFNMWHLKKIILEEFYGVKHGE